MRGGGSPGGAGGASPSGRRAEDPSAKGGAVGQKSDCVLRVEEREEVPEEEDELSFGESNSRAIAAKIISICDGSAASSGGGSQHRDHGVSVAELKSALFRSEFNGFVTWLMRNESAVFAAFDNDNSKTLDYDELIYAIELYEFSLREEMDEKERAKEKEDQPRETAEDRRASRLARRETKRAAEAAKAPPPVHHAAGQLRVGDVAPEPVPAPTADEAQALEDAATTLDILAVNTITSRVRFAEDNEEDLDLIHWEVGRTQSSMARSSRIAVFARSSSNGRRARAGNV